MSMSGMPTTASTAWRLARAKKSWSDTHDSIDDDESTMTSPNTTRNTVVPSSRKYSGVSALKMCRTRTTAVAPRPSPLGSGGGSPGRGRTGGRVVVIRSPSQVPAHRLGEPPAAIRVVRELIHRRRRRGQQHHVALAGDGCGRADRGGHHVLSLRSVDLEHRDAGRVSCERGAQRLPVDADQHGGPQSLDVARHE